MLDAITGLRDALEKRASFKDLRSVLSSLDLPGLPEEDWAAVLAAAGGIVSSDLSWLSRDHREDLKNRTVAFFKKAVTISAPAENVDDSLLANAMGPFVEWLSRQTDSKVLDFVWDTLAYRRFGNPHRHCALKMHRSGRLAGEISLETLDCAIVLAAEADAMMWGWPESRWELADWTRDSPTYWKCLEHSSCLIRATGAKALGALFLGFHTEKQPNPPRLSEVLRVIQVCEQRTPGVAGAFFHGAQWSIEDWTPFSEGIDFRAWILDTLRTSARERELPHIQTLEFYAHEYLCTDADAIRQMLRMGRDELAVMTATESPEHISALGDLPQEMAASENPRVARAIQTYLSHPFHQSGLECMDPEVSLDEQEDLPEAQHARQVKIENDLKALDPSDPSAALEYLRKLTT